MMTAINYFKILRRVIDDCIDRIAADQQRERTEVYMEVVGHLRNNSAQWMSGRPPNLPYKEPLCRIAYLYGQVAANAGLVERVFTSDTDLATYADREIRETSCLQVCAFGGGPGTELLGLAKGFELQAREDQVALDFLLVDTVAEWSESWRSLRRGIESGMRSTHGPDRRNWPVTLNGDFAPVDICDASCYADMPSLFDQRLFVLSYVMSEVFDDDEKIDAFADRLVGRAPSGARFVFIDRNERKSGRERRWQLKVEQLARRAGLGLSEFQEERGKLDTSEQASDLGGLLDGVGRSPRVTWDAFWVVGTKA